jgi:hypothetical protein
MADHSEEIRLLKEASNAINDLLYCLISNSSIGDNIPRFSQGQRLINAVQELRNVRRKLDLYYERAQTS